jgi:hypothetical protein
MQEVSVIHWCDHPECIERRPEMEGGQDVKETRVWFYTKGAKREPIRVELCQEHEDEMRALYHALSKYDMNVTS